MLTHINRTNKFCLHHKFAYISYQGRAQPQRTGDIWQHFQPNSQH